jgi:hypothetical protein
LTYSAQPAIDMLDDLVEWCRTVWDEQQETLAMEPRDNLSKVNYMLDEARYHLKKFSEGWS